MTTFAAKTEWVFVASPTQGIYSYKLDADHVSLLEGGRAAEFDGASFLALHPNGNFLYAVAEGGSAKDSLVASFSIDRETGKLKLLNQFPSGGRGPCHLCVNPTGEAVMVANYTSGSLAAFPIRACGSLMPMSALIQNKGSSIRHDRQAGPHAHCIISGSKSRYALACDLGLDKVLIFKFHPEDATISANNPPFVSLKPGAGPRHIAMHPNNKFAYVINELGSTLTVFSWDGKGGKLAELQDISTLPQDFHGTNYPAEVAVHPNGKFVYGSNRGHDSIVIFKIDSKAGTVSLVGHQPCGGHWPRHFEIDTTGKLMFVANEQSAKTTIFKIDQGNGTLTPDETAITLDQPKCVKCLDTR